MVKFSLLCEQAHGFEAWFQSNESFEAQQAEMQIYCPHCASSVVRKALMAPNLSSPKTKSRTNNTEEGAQAAQSPTGIPTNQPSPASNAGNHDAPDSHAPDSHAPDSHAPDSHAPDSHAPDSQPVMHVSDKNTDKGGMPNMQQMAQMVRHMHRVVAENCTNVGAKFADEARKMHQGETESKPIYGTSTAEERAELAEDGIAFAQLPDLPKDN